MTKKWILPGLLAAVLLAAAATGWMRIRPPEPGTADVTAGPFNVWVMYNGTLDSRTVVNIMSRLGSATIVELAPDGTMANAGDILARLDASAWERDLPRAERDFTLARTELEAMENAKLPLELRDLEVRLGEARIKLADELQALEDNRELARENLISAQEVKQQEVKAAAARTQVESLEQQLELTKKYLQPSSLDRARATLASARQELEHLRTEVSNCVLRAPSGGMVSYKAMPFSDDFRTPRTGDVVYRNQCFMTLADMSNLVVRCEVPESDLTRIQPGAAAVIQPLAYPEMRLKGAVEALGSMAQRMGRHDGRKYFSVTLALETADAGLRPGMSAQVRVQAYSTPKAVLAPRAAVWWEEGQAWCTRQTGARAEKTRIKTGMANETHFEILEGLQPGDRVVIR